VNGVTINGTTINGTGTVVFQAETPGSAAVSNVVASDVGVAGVYDYGYPNNQAGTFAFNLGSGNSGWSTTPLWTTFPQPGDQPPPPSSNLALHQPTSESSHTQVYGSGNAVDGDANTYWESANNAFPQWLQVDLGSAKSIGSVVLKLPPTWGARTQTLSVLGSSDGATFSTIKASADYAFDPASANTVTIPVSATTRYVRVNVTANTGWPAGQVSELEVYAP
jgi:hypothetical protein